MSLRPDLSPEATSPRMPGLDGIRGLAILLVLVWHYFASMIRAEPGSTVALARRWFGLTWSGVDLFFVLSGFLIGGILIDNRQSVNYFKAFYTRRVCRIFPLYFLWLLLFFILREATMLSKTSLSWLLDNPLPSLSYLTFTQNFAMAIRGTFGNNWLGITWSLAIEEQFYLILPFIIRYVKPRKLPWLLAGLILTAPALRLAFFYWKRAGTHWDYVLPLCRADSLLLGVLCAWALRQQAIAQFLRAQTKALYALLAILLVGVAVLTIRTPFVFSFGMISLGYSWLALLYACLLLIVVTETRGVVSVVASNVLLRRLGTIAYGVYIIHQGVFGLSHKLFLNQAPRIVGRRDLIVSLFALAATLGLAGCSWKFFEKPLVRFGHMFQYNSNRPVPPKETS